VDIESPDPSSRRILALVNDVRPGRVPARPMVLLAPRSAQQVAEALVRTREARWWRARDLTGAGASRETRLVRRPRAPSAVTLVRGDRSDLGPADPSPQQEPVR
jgi:hypothetical protein